MGVYDLRITYGDEPAGESSVHDAVGAAIDALRGYVGRRWNYSFGHQPIPDDVDHAVERYFTGPSFDSYGIEEAGGR
jgi:hypothetical protein